MKWIACEKSIYKICIKNMCLVLIYSGFYCIIWVNKLRLCLFCIKTDDAIEKRERQKEYIERCVVSVAFLCDSKNKPPAMQGEGRSLDISNLLC